MDTYRPKGNTMAGARDGVFVEKLSPFLRTKLAEAHSDPVLHKSTLTFLKRQYSKDPAEFDNKSHEVRRHYESELNEVFDGKKLLGVEKLYRRTILIEPTTICAAHCRWCIRGQYDTLTLSEPELDRIARYCGTAPNNAEVREVLVTGGDPLMLVDRLHYLLDAIECHAPNIAIVRIGTRVPLQDPRRVDDRMLTALHARSTFRIEIATHVNHPGELFPEVREAYQRLHSTGARLYDQSVLLRGVNDNVDTLAELFDELRYLGIEVHYLFHCVPIRGMEHHRTSISTGLELIRRLTSSGMISGRAKPMYTLLTDVGKVTMYEGAIIDRDSAGRVLLRTGYSYTDRKRWNPRWQLPPTAQVDDRDFLQVWYLDNPTDEHLDYSVTAESRCDAAAVGGQL